MIEFAIERASEIEGEIRDLLPEHLGEFDIYEPPFEPVIDFPMYRAIDHAGRLLTVTARDDGVLVGYWLGLKFNDPHHHVRGHTAPVIMGQVFHIRASYRAKIAKQMFQFMESVAERGGAVAIAQRVRPKGGPRSGAFLEAIGYIAAEAVFVKPLGEARNA